MAQSTSLYSQALLYYRQLFVLSERPLETHMSCRVSRQRMATYSVKDPGMRVPSTDEGAR